MPLLITEANKLSNNDLIRGIVEEIIDTDQVFQFLPFVRTEGKAYVYNRENQLASVQFIVPNVDVPEAASTFTEVVVTLRILAGDVDVDNFLAETQSDTNSQRAIQIALKAKALSRHFADKFVNGDESTSYDLSSLGGGGAVTNVEFDGIDELVVAGQSFITENAVNGAAYSFEEMDRLHDQVPLGADAYVMTKRTYRGHMKLLRAMGAASPEYVQMANGRNIAAYGSTPILINDFISDVQTVGTSTTCSNVYALRMNESDGLHGVWGGDQIGVRFQDIGQLEKRDATRSRLKWYVCLALKGTKSLARMTGVLAV